jgi:hypothetical protein
VGAKSVPDNYLSAGAHGRCEGRPGMTRTSAAGKVATPPEGEYLADDQVIDACVRAWLGPVALLTIGLRVVVASVQADQGRRSKARGVRTTLPVPQLGAAPKRPAASKQAARKTGGRPPRTHDAARRGHNNGAFRRSLASLKTRARWFD